MILQTSRTIAPPVVVAGMHRSGTSLVARLLHECGLYLGEPGDLMTPQPDNPEGFWENERFVAINDALLSEVGCAWDCPPARPIGADSSSDPELRKEAEALLGEFSGRRWWGWKDPRNSLTLPYWMDLLPDVTVVICLRNPLEVALSLRRRNQFSYDLSLGLWETYNRHLIESVPAARRIVTHYDAYFDPDRAELSRLLGRLGTEPTAELPRSGAAASAAMKHARSTRDQLRAADVSRPIRDLYDLLCREAGWEDGEADRPAGHPTENRNVMRKVDSRYVDLESMRSELEQRTSWARRLQSDLDERDARIRELEGALRQFERGPEDQERQAGRLDELAGGLRQALEAWRLEQERRVDALHERLDDLAVMVGEVFVKAADPRAVAQFEHRILVRRVRDAVGRFLPHDATVLVVSKGDEEIVKLGGRRAWHFPRDAEGRYAGFHPADSGSAIVQLEALRSAGAEYFLLPESASWWLEHYVGFGRHLERHYRLIAADPSCRIYSLREPPAAVEARAGEVLQGVIAELVDRLGRDPSVLDWDSGLGLASLLPGQAVFQPPRWSGPELPYWDGTVDVVVTASDDPATLAEARRVAGAAVVKSSPRDGGAKPAADVEWLEASRSSPLPSASLVIPSYNGIKLTEDCLAALAETLPADVSVEIIVVDDCSTDDTAARLARWAEREPRLKVLRNAVNSGFLVTCNNGAAAASGDVVILMNNDTLPQRGWLEPLLRLLRDRPDAGAVGSKLVYPDGRLQEAGGVVFSDGSAANFGKWDYEIDAPIYNYVREVDYVTGALIATRRSLFEELGGLDLRYRPIYYEETDYCFRLRERGYKVYYQPESVVIHLEGVTCGTDPTSGQKRYQVVNREKFVERWREALEHQPDAPSRYDRATWHSLAVRGRREGVDDAR